MSLRQGQSSIHTDVLTPSGRFVFVEDSKTISSLESKTAQMSSDVTPTLITLASTFAPRLAIESEKKARVPSDEYRVKPTIIHGLKLSSSVFNVRTVLRSIYMTNPYRTRLGVTLAFNSSSVGVLNSAISCSGAASLTEFPSFATIFDEFFVHGMITTFIPRNRYQFPVTAGPSVSTCNCLLTVTPLYHGTGGYVSSSAAMNNSLTAVHSTADPFGFTWRNNEDPDVGIMVSPSITLPTACQSWCSTNSTAAVLYEGQIQYLGAAAIGPGTGVVTVGDFAVSYDISFRVRA
jgi:hypothetical protein